MPIVNLKGFALCRRPPILDSPAFWLATFLASLSLSCFRLLGPVEQYPPGLFSPPAPTGTIPPGIVLTPWAHWNNTPRYCFDSLDPLKQYPQSLIFVSFGSHILASLIAIGWSGGPWGHPAAHLGVQMVFFVDFLSFLGPSWNPLGAHFANFVLLLGHLS